MQILLFFSHPEMCSAYFIIVIILPRFEGLEVTFGLNYIFKRSRQMFQLWKLPMSQIENGPELMADIVTKA